MGLCTICVRRVGARLGMVASSVERESQRRVNSYRVVARGASCQGQPRPLLPLPTASPRRKSDCQRRHKHNAFLNSSKWLLLVSLSLFSYFSSLCRALLWRSSAKVKPLRIVITPTPPSLPSPSLFSFFFPEFFLCAVPLESAGCNYVHVNQQIRTL
jgi:hypothetical protein